jgi:hypothetical protein
MSLLSEIAITPDVLREDGYGSTASCPLSLAFLRPILYDEVLVRDLHSGAWSKMILTGAGNWHQSGKELVKKLRARCRLIPAESEGEEEPANDLAWGQEAIQSHHHAGLAAIIAGKSLQAQLQDQKTICSVEKVHTSEWWQSRSCSVRLRRQTKDYIEALKLVLQHANSMMFVDPHLDPSRRNYAEFGQVLSVAQRSHVKPKVELHRVCYDGSGPNRRLLTLRDLQERFTPLGEKLGAVELGAEVFVWDDFHDRYLISNLIGVSLLNGFDTSGNTDERTTWSRLSTKDRDDIQREFDEASNTHALNYKFRIGAGT